MATKISKFGQKINKIISIIINFINYHHFPSLCHILHNKAPRRFVYVCILYIFVVNSSRISREKCSNSGLDSSPADRTIGEGGSARDASRKVAAWEKYNSNLENKSESGICEGGCTHKVLNEPKGKIYKVTFFTSAERQTLHSRILLNERFSSSRSEANNAA